MNKFFARLLGAIPQNRPASDAARPNEPGEAIEPIENDKTASRQASQQARRDQERDLSEQRQAQRTERKNVWQRLVSERILRPHAATKAGPLEQAQQAVMGSGPRQRQQAPGGGFTIVGGGGMLGGARRKVAAGAARGMRSMGMRAGARGAIAAGGGGSGAAGLAGGAGAAGLVAGGVTALAAAIPLSIAAIKKWTDSLVESRRHLGKYNGQIAASLARLDVGDIKRNIKFAGATGKSTAGLNKSIDEFRDAILPIQEDLRNAFNKVAELIVNIATFVSKGYFILEKIIEFGTALPLIGQLLDKINDAIQEEVNQGQIPAATFLNELQQGIQPNRPPLQPINP